MTSRWIGFGSDGSIDERREANKGGSGGCLKVCKTFIRGFDSPPRLQPQFSDLFRSSLLP